ncbi:MAG: dihydroxyacetone kinase subunit DhaL [Chloroflexota bacterium]
MFNLRTFRLWFDLLAQTFQSQAEALNELDRVIGDGDHGYTLARAFASAADAVENANPLDIGSLLDVAASALAENAGGAIGPLLAAFFAEGGVLLQNKSVCSMDELADFFQNGVAAVNELGGARAGQKTLVDALLPAAQELAQHRSTTDPIGALEKVLMAARRGAEATRQMSAVFGRAAFLGERSIGYLDPGAFSFSLILECFWSAALGKEGKGTNPQPEEMEFVPPGKFINHPDHIVQEDNQGLSLAYPGIVRYLEDGFLVRAESKVAGKVGLAMGHGGGHTPSMGGLVGFGLLDADVYGPIFTCASGIKIARAIHLADRGAGVVLLVSNHSGDVLNARMALRRASQMGITVQPVFLGDDVATAPRSELEKRRGLGGLLFALKIGGAAAEDGQPLCEVVRLMEKCNLRTATLAVAVRAPTHPASGKRLFELPAGQMEIGTGVHGEVGVYRGAMLPANQVVDLVLQRLLEDLSGLLQQRVLVFLNGSGGTSQMELNILYRRVFLALHEQGVQIAAGVVDSLFTTQEMGGFSLSLCAADDELEEWWQRPALAAHFRWPMDRMC